MDELQPFAVALAIGLLMGLEREWSQRAKRHKPAGSRTFAVLALAGALAAAVGPAVVAAGLLVAGALTVAGYLRERERDVGLTTEVATVAAYLVGALAYDDAGSAVAVGVAVTVVLASKEPLHRFAREVITQAEVEDALKFFVTALIVLPLLPEGDRGPYGVLDPSRIWMLVVLITGVGWAGYVAVRLLGARRGLPIAGLAGGFVSGAATTGALARAWRTASAAKGSAAGSGPYLAGAFMASVSTLVQLVIVVAAANRDLTADVVPAAAAGSVLLVASAVWAVRAGPAPSPDEDDPSEPVGILSGRPFALKPALVLAGVLTAVLLLSRWAIDTFGSVGATVTAAVAGLADAHGTIAATATLVGRGDLGSGEGLVAIALALGTNTVTKVALALAAGGRSFATRYVAGILPAAVVTGGLLLM